MGMSTLVILIAGLVALASPERASDTAHSPVAEGPGHVLELKPGEPQSNDVIRPGHVPATPPGAYSLTDPSLLPNAQKAREASAGPDASTAPSVTGPSVTSETSEEPTDTTSEPTSTSSTQSPDTTARPSGSVVTGPVVVSGESGVVLEGMKISNPNGPCVQIKGSSEIVVRASEIGPCGDRAVEIQDSSAVTIEGLAIHDSSSGVYAINSQHVAVVGNRFTNAGRNFVQFDKVTGSGNSISRNSGANKLGSSSAEDFVSVYKSSGTPGSPLTVASNSFRDGGPSGSGSGIMVGDYGGSHILVQGNTLINPGQAGIGVPGGTNIRVIDNVVYSGSQPWSNVGIYVWNQSGGSCGSIEVKGNRVEWYGADGAENPSWDGGNCGAIAGWDTNDWHANIG